MNATWNTMFHLDIIAPQVIHCLSWNGMDIHDGIRPSCSSSNQMARIDHHRAFQNRRGKASKFRRHDQYVWFTRKLKVVHLVQIQIGGYGCGRRKQRVEASLLQQVLRDPMETRPWRQVSIGLLHADVHEDVRGRDAKYDLIQLESTWICLLYTSPSPRD